MTHLAWLFVKRDMGRKALPKNRTLDPEVRKEWLAILVPYFIKNGFHRITTNDIAQQLGISKATLYEHFSSRDEIFTLVINHVIDTIREKKQILVRDDLTYQERYAHLFGLILEQVMGISSVLLEDIEMHYPKLWQLIQDFFQEWDDGLREFFDLGVKADEFNPMHPAIMSKTITALLRELMSPIFLIKNNISVNDAFIDGFRMHYRGIVRADKAKAEETEALFSKVIEETLLRAAKMAF